MPTKPTQDEVSLDTADQEVIDETPEFVKNIKGAEPERVAANIPTKTEAMHPGDVEAIADNGVEYDLKQIVKILTTVREAIHRVNAASFGRDEGDTPWTRDIGGKERQVLALSGWGEHNMRWYLFKEDKATMVTILHEIAHEVAGSGEGEGFYRQLLELWWRFGSIAGLDKYVDDLAEAIGRPASGLKRLERIDLSKVL